ncbi:DUF167 domain-containing protein [Elusimicrobiota bacterium]
MVIVDLKVQPSSSKRKIIRTTDGGLKIYLHSAPEKNKANRELIKYLAEELGISKSGISIEKGGTSRKKVIKIAGITAEDLKKIIKKP